MTEKYVNEIKEELIYEVEALASSQTKKSHRRKPEYQDQDYVHIVHSLFDKVSRMKI